MKKHISFYCILCCILCFSMNMAVVAHAEDANNEITEVVTEVLLNQVDHSWDGVTLEAYPNAQPAITLLKISVPPRTKLKRHYHSVINVGYMLEGELTVVADNGKTTTIKAGDPLIEMVGPIHYGENTGDKPAVILVFYAGDVATTITTAVE